MVGNLFKVLDSASAKTAGIAALGTELLINKPTKLEYWNYLEFTNRSGADIEIRLDRALTGIKVKQITPATLGVLDAEEGLQWQTVEIKNLSGTTAIAADEVLLVVAAKREFDTVAVRL